MVLTQEPPSWDSILIGRQSPQSLVGIAREGRLVRDLKGPVHVSLSAVDECVLALLDLALRKHQSINFVYPAPAGEVSVLLAAQILLHGFLERGTRSVGILTADTVGASRAWEALCIEAVGSRTRLSEVFPCYRAGPEGESPLGKRSFRGVLIGQRFTRWTVDMVVIDNLAGPTFGDVTVPAVRIFADSLDPLLETLSEQNKLIWGWTPGALPISVQDDTRSQIAPFSVAHDRLRAIAASKGATIHVVHHAVAERYITCVRDDLRTLANLFGPSPPQTIAKGIRIAWHHLSTLASLPCRPSDFDRFAGMPPIAARATSSFEQEIGAWAGVLEGDAGDIAGVIASDLGDLRAALEDCNPYLVEIAKIAEHGPETLVVVRTHTAARGLLLGLGGEPNGHRLEHIQVRAITRLHHEGTWEKAIVVGMVPKWDWHRLDSGLALDLQVLTLGERDAHTSAMMLKALQESRHRWGGPRTRERVWEALLDELPPPTPNILEKRREFRILDAGEFSPPTDPFAPFEALLVSGPLLIGEEGVEETVAALTEEGSWVASVKAAQIQTDMGILLLPLNRLVEVRHGERLIYVRVAELQVGMSLLIGRRDGRLGLIEALSDRLRKHRPDLYAATLLISDLQTSVRNAFKTSGLTKVELHRRLVALGFAKTYHTTRGYVEPSGPLAPRDYRDLDLLNKVLELEYSNRHLAEIFAGVKRTRGFRRGAGRTLAEAARGSTVAIDLNRIHPETGLSLADLREAVVEATIISVSPLSDLVSIGDIGRFERNR